MKKTAVLRIAYSDNRVLDALLYFLEGHKDVLEIELDDANLKECSSCSRMLFQEQFTGRHGTCNRCRVWFEIIRRHILKVHKKEVNVTSARKIYKEIILPYDDFTKKPHETNALEEAFLEISKFIRKSKAK